MLSKHHYKNLSDEELISLYKETDDVEIVGVLFDRYTALTFGVCLKYLKDREESRDAVMQIFEKLIVNLKTHAITSFKGWLYVTARNYCLMQLRAKKGKNFEQLSPLLMETGSNGHQDHGADIEGNLVRLEKCMDSLADEQRECVRLFYLQQKCYKEITENTGYDLNKVKSYIQNGKRNLKICMERNENRKHDIERYLRGELSPAEMHALEKEALNDPFLAEALEGVEQAGADIFLYDLHRINRSVHDRTRARKKKNKKTIQMWGWTTGIAATLFLIVVSGFLVIGLLKEQRTRQHSMNGPATTQEDSQPIADSQTVERKQKTEGPMDTAGEVLKEEESIASREQAFAEQPSSANANPQETVAKPDQPIGQKKSGSERISDDAPTAEIERALADQPKEVAAAKDRKEVSSKKTSDLAQTETSAKAGAPLRYIGSTLLKGNVISAADNQPLPGVNVLIKGTDIGTVTDVNGDYELLIPEPDTKLLYSSIGYQAREVEVKNNQEVNVALEEDVTSLSEVVVTREVSAKSTAGDKSTYHLAEPMGGRTEFKNYLLRSVQYPVQALQNKTEGKVTVSFTVEPDGQLTDFEVLKGIGSGCEEALIRAISQGPSWKPSAKGDSAIREKVKVRFRFQLPGK